MGVPEAGMAGYGLDSRVKIRIMRNIHIYNVVCKFDLTMFLGGVSGMFDESGSGFYRKKRTPGEMVRMRRKELDWTQDDLEWSSGVSRTQISRIERNIAKPSFDTIGKLEEALQFPLLKEFLEYSKSSVSDEKSPKSRKKVLRKIEKDLIGLKLTEEELRSVMDRVQENADFDGQ